METKEKSWERQEKPVLQELPEEIEIPLPYIPLYPHLPRPTAPKESDSDGNMLRDSPQKERSELQKVREERQDDQAGCLRSGHAWAMQMPLRETWGPIYYDEPGQVQGGQWTFIYQPFTTTDLLNWKHHKPSYMENTQALIDLMQSIFQTHNPTWPDCRQLLLTLFNTEERWRVTQAALCWLEANAPEGTLNVQACTQDQFPEADPHWDSNDAGQLQYLQKY